MALAKWPHASQTVRTTLEQGMREWVEFEVGEGGRRALYWITPKSAHTTIMRLLRCPPFRLVGVSKGHNAQGSAFAADARPNATNGQAQQDSMPGALNLQMSSGADESNRHLADALARRPLEFTFVRDPLTHLIAAASQLRHCFLATPPAHSHYPPGAFGDKSPRLYSGHELVKLLEMSLRDQMPDGAPAAAAHKVRYCAKHLYPQSAGYGFELDRGRRTHGDSHALDGRSSGVRRLHFVGRMEHFAEDSAALLRALGVEASPASNATRCARRWMAARANHRAQRPILKAGSGLAWREIVAHPLVRQHLAWDYNCWLNRSHGGAARRCFFMKR